MCLMGGLGKLLARTLRDFAANLRCFIRNLTDFTGWGVGVPVLLLGHFASSAGVQKDADRRYGHQF